MSAKPGAIAAESIVNTTVPPLSIQSISSYHEHNGKKILEIRRCTY